MLAVEYLWNGLSTPNLVIAIGLTLDTPIDFDFAFGPRLKRLC